MGKGSYSGGGTIIGANTPSWFAQENTVVSDEYKIALERHLAAKSDYEMLLSQADQNRGSKKFQKRLEEARKRIQRTLPRPSKAEAAKPLDSQAEQQIAALKRDLAAFATSARSALRQHEVAREKFVALLKRHGLPIEHYPETKKLKL